MKFQPAMKPHLIQPSATDTPSVQIQLLGRAPYSSRDPVRMHSLGIALQRQQGVHAIASDRRVDFDTWPGTLSHTPAGIEVFSESATGGEYLVLRYAPHEADAPGPSRRVSRTGQRAALQIALHLRRLLLCDRPDALAIEQSALRLLECSKSGPRIADAHPDAGYGRVLDRIAAEFDRPLRIADLSAMVDTSPLRFLREFTRRTGMTPHAWITETRLQAARAMLQSAYLPLVQIALECGFNHQSHMGQAFRKHLGLTPGRYRQPKSPSLTP
ncbi:AraC family transcriptional regulator [Comamonas testosteroni]|nr:AraC family transcriptional regulator [Comamonas testosteroni]